MKEKLELVARFMGYIYLDEVDDAGEWGWEKVKVYSKIPIETFGVPGEKYFANVPNPDFGNKDSTRWRSDYETLCWSTVNKDQFITHLNYDTSWDSLLPVVKKIKDLDIMDEPLVVIQICIQDGLLDIDIESTFKCVVDWIELYEELKKVLFLKARRRR